MLPYPVQAGDPNGAWPPPSAPWPHAHSSHFAPQPQQQVIPPHAPTDPRHGPTDPRQHRLAKRPFPAMTAHQHAHGEPPSSPHEQHHVQEPEPKRMRLSPHGHYEMDAYMALKNEHDALDAKYRALHQDYSRLYAMLEHKDKQIASFSAAKKKQQATIHHGYDDKIMRYKKQIFSMQSKLTRCNAEHRNFDHCLHENRLLKERLSGELQKPKLDSVSSSRSLSLPDDQPPPPHSPKKEVLLKKIDEVLKTTDVLKKIDESETDDDDDIDDDNLLRIPMKKEKSFLKPHKYITNVRVSSVN